MRDPDLSYASLENLDFGIPTPGSEFWSPPNERRYMCTHSLFRGLCGATGRRNHPSKAVRGHSSQFLESLDQSQGEAEFWSPPKELRYKFRAEERIRPRFCADNDLIPQDPSRR